VNVAGTGGDERHHFVYLWVPGPRLGDHGKMGEVCGKVELWVGLKYAGSWPGAVKDSGPVGLVVNHQSMLFL